MQSTEPHLQKSGKLSGRERRPPNNQLRPREYLTAQEVNNMLFAASEPQSRYPLRDKLMIMMAYRHGMRAQEICNLTWDQLDFQTAHIHITRKKMGNPSVQPLSGDELRLLRKHQREQKYQSRFVFLTERQSPVSTDTFHNLVQRAGKLAKIPFPVHPHMLRHACGYTLANKGVETRAIQDYLGHRSMQSTVLYTQLSANKFKGFDKLI